MKVGFTGTRRGMTTEQRRRVAHFLIEAATQDDELHHGNCIGADEEAAMIAGNLDYKTVAHPAIVGKMLTTKFVSHHTVRPAKDPLERNQDIVNATHLLIAAPAQKAEQRRSGTWATIRYARAHSKRVVIVYPDGTFSS